MVGRHRDFHRESAPHFGANSFSTTGGGGTYGLLPRSRGGPATAKRRRPNQPVARYSRRRRGPDGRGALCTMRSEEHTSELQSHLNLVCRLLLEKQKAPSIPTT